MSRQPPRRIEIDKPPRTGVLFRLGTDVRSRDLRRVAEQASPAYNVQPVLHQGDYMGWVTQPGSEQMDSLPTQDAPDPRDSLWRDIEQALDQEFNVLDTVVMREEQHDVQVNHPTYGEVTMRSPVLARERVQPGRVGLENVPQPDPSERVPSGVVDLDIRVGGRQP